MAWCLETAPDYLALPRAAPAALAARRVGRVPDASRAPLADGRRGRERVIAGAGRHGGGERSAYMALGWRAVAWRRHERRASRALHGS